MRYGHPLVTHRRRVTAALHKLDGSALRPLSGAAAAVEGAGQLPPELALA